MSLICSLNGLNARICRQAFLLAHHRFRTDPLPVVGTAFARSSHSSLYKMVKKRTLEARTKLQSSKFPNNQPCLPSNKNYTDLSDSPAINSSTISLSKAMSSGPQAAATVQTTKFMKRQMSREIAPVNAAGIHCDSPNTNVCLNTQVLKADCNARREERQCPPPPPPSKGGGGSGSGCDVPPPDNDRNVPNNKKILMGLLAAMAAGGLLMWLIGSTGKKDDCIKKPVCSGGSGGSGGSSRAAPKTPKNQTIPASSSQLPKHIPYLLIGGGTASFSAFRAIKSNDPRAKVLMVTNELQKPYMRPPLSKELWYSTTKCDVGKDYRFKQWTGAERSLFFEPDEFFVDPAKLVESVNGGIAVAEGFSVKKIDPNNRIVTLNDGYEISYDECLIATGCTPKNLHVFDNAPMSVKERIMVYRTPEDFERLKQYADAKKSITIVGNGFIGSELACSLASYEKEQKGKIYQVFPESGNMSRVLPDYLSKWTTEKVAALGVCVVPNAAVQEAKRDESMVKLTLNNGVSILTDIVVVCVGCEANTSIANYSGLEVDRQLGGFVVNAELEARRNLFVAGDASCFYDPLLGRRRVEHHDHSVVSGRLAGENMVGKKKAYSHQSMFWSDLGPEIGYEGIGLVDASLPTVGVFALPSKADRQSDNLTESRMESKESVGKLKGGKSNVPDTKCPDTDIDNYGRGVIFYLKDEKIVGILLWNLFNRIGLARTIINQNKKYDDLNEVAKLFEIHS